MFDLEKLEQSVAWLLRKYNGRLNAGKLVKLMYLADKEVLKEKRMSITGDDYCALDKGPAPARLCALLSGDGEPDAQREWDSLFKKEGDDIVALKELPRDWISDCDVDALDAVDARFHDRDAEEISEWTHDPQNCPEWRDPHGGTCEPTDMGGRLAELGLPITKADILKAMGKSDDAIAFILEEDAMYDAFARAYAVKPKPL